MPKTTKAGKAKQDELPSTLQRSDAKAQQTFAKTYDSAAETYDGDEERAARTAYAALKHSFEKVGDRWQPKKVKGPSDPQAAKSGKGARKGGKTFGGVDVVGNTRKTLYERAKALGIKGRSSMSKEELGEAIARNQ